MDIFAVLVAAAIAFAIGALWYGVFSKQWVAASGVPTDEIGAPIGANSPVKYLGAFICILFVSGMMRHVFSMAEIDTMLKGLMAGGGIGLFIIAPWITLNVLFAMRPKALAVIDGGYAAVACTVMGLVLVAMM
jgi:hypothetical protein